MKAVRKLIEASAVAAFLFLAPTVCIHAQCSPAYDDGDWDPCTLQGLTLEGGIIWWKPCIGDLDFAAMTAIEEEMYEVEGESIHPDWELGFRIAASYQRFLSNWRLEASWTHLRPEGTHKTVAHGEDRLASPLLHPLLIEELDSTSEGGFKKAKGEYAAQYSDWDLLVSRDVICTRCQRVTPYFGLAGFIFDQSQKIFLKSPHEADYIDRAWIKWKSDYYGLGLRAGSVYEYKIHPCIGLFANAQATLVAGRTAFKNKQTITYGEVEEPSTINLEVQDRHSWHLVPGYHIFTGIAYSAHWWESNFVLRLGYEFLTWFDLPNPQVYANPGDPLQFSGESEKMTRTIGFQGLFATLALRF